MGINRDASSAEIKRAFRQRSVELHPDKDPSLTATEEFNKLRVAFDVRGMVLCGTLIDVYLFFVPMTLFLLMSW